MQCHLNVENGAYICSFILFPILLKYGNLVLSQIFAAGHMTAWHAVSRRFDPRVQQLTFVEIGHEIISTVIISLPLIQAGQLSVTGKRMRT